MVPPTPPAGMGTVVLPGEFATDPARMVGRPEAPGFAFDPPREEALGPICPACSTQNPETNRFCVSCGARLPTGLAPIPPQPAALPVPPGQGFAPGYAATAAVPQFSPTTAAPPPRVVCARCNGASDATMLYCQFCGASLRPDNRPRTSSVVPPPMRADAAHADPFANAPHPPRASSLAPAPATAARSAGGWSPSPATAPKGSSYPLTRRADRHRPRGRGTSSCARTPTSHPGTSASSAARTAGTQRPRLGERHLFCGSANRTPSSTETCSWWAFRC